MKEEFVLIKNDLSRIVIFGASCSGKSFLAEGLGKIILAPVFHLDDHFFKPNWRIPDRIEFRNRISQLIHHNQRWIVDGNYTIVRDVVLSKVTLIIILDLPFFISLWRIFIRTIGRNTRFKIGSISPLPKQILESGAKEPILLAFWELGLHALKFKHRKILRRIIIERQKVSNPNKIIIFRNTRAIKHFMYQLEQRLL